MLTTQTEQTTPLPSSAPPVIAPLTPLEWKRHERQQSCIRDRARRIKDHDRNRYWLAAYFVKVRRERLWQRDPRYAQLDFVDYIGAVLLDKDWSRTTVERYVTIAEKYTEEQFRRYREKDTSFTVLAEVQRLPETVRNAVLRLCADRKITRDDLEAIKKSDVSLVCRQPEAQELDQALRKVLGKGGNRRGQPRGSGDKGQGDAGALGGAEVEALRREQRELERRQQALTDQERALTEQQQAISERQRDSERRELELQEQRNRLLQERSEAETAGRAQAAARAEIEAAERRLKETEEALSRRAEEQELRERLQREAQAAGVTPDVMLKQQFDKLRAEREVLNKDVQASERIRAEAQGRLGAVVERERQAQAAQDAFEKEQETLQKATDELAQARRELDAAVEKEKAALARDHAALAESRDALAQEKAALEQAKAAFAEEQDELSERETEIEEKEAAIEEKAAMLLEKEEKLDDGLFQLDIKQKEVAEQESFFEDTEARIRDQLSLLLRYSAQQCVTRFPDEPWNVEATLSCLRGHFEAVAALGKTLAEQTDDWDGEQGEPEHVVPLTFELVKLINKVPDVLHKNVETALRELGRQHPVEVVAAIAKFKKDQEDLAKGNRLDIKEIQLTGDRIVSRFAVPTAALLGTADSDSPVQIALGTDKRGNLINLCMNEVHAIVIAGQQNSGKSSTVQGILEAMVGSGGEVENVVCGARDAAGVVFNFNNEPGAKPLPLEQWMMPNDEKKGVQRLRDLHRARPRGMKPLRRIVYVVALAPGELEQAEADYPTAEVRPIKFSFAELGAAGVRMFMGASKNASFYMRKVDGIIANLKDFTLAGFLAAIEATEWTKQQDNLVKGRLDQLVNFVHDGAPMGKDLRPGDLALVDIRSPKIEAGIALTVFVSMMRAFAQARVTTRSADGTESSRLFKKIFIFDEAHRYLGAEHGCATEIVNTIKEMRHKEANVIILTQDPLSLPAPMIRLATMLILHRIKSLDSLRYVARNFAGWDTGDMKGLIKELSLMEQGEARIMVTDCANLNYRTSPQVLYVRPTLSKPGGTTRKSIDEEAASAAQQQAAAPTEDG